MGLWQPAEVNSPPNGEWEGGSEGGGMEAECFGGQNADWDRHTVEVGSAEKAYAVLPRSLTRHPYGEPT